MAATIAKLSKYKGGRDVFGSRGKIWMVYTGPTAYANPGGDEVDTIPVGANQTGLRSIGSIDVFTTVSGLYAITAQPTSVSLSGPPTKWILRWWVLSTQAEVANGVNLSAEQSIAAIEEG